MKEIKRNDIYYAELDPVVGSEQGGLRPVLILQNDTGNRHSPTTIVAAITSSPRKTNLPTHITVQTKGLTKESIVLLEQIRTIDKDRLETIFTVLDGLKNRPMTYDDEVVRQLIDCVVVESKDRIKVVFCGGLQVEQPLQQEDMDFLLEMGPLAIH